MVRASFCETTAKAHQLGAPPRWQVKQVLGFDIERVVCGNLHAVWYAAPVVVVPLQVARTLGSVKGRVTRTSRLGRDAVPDGTHEVAACFVTGRAPRRSER
jgi:hypothetical protein